MNCADFFKKIPTKRAGTVASDSILFKYLILAKS